MVLGISSPRILIGVIHSLILDRITGRIVGQGDVRPIWVYLLVSKDSRRRVDSGVRPGSIAPWRGKSTVCFDPGLLLVPTGEVLTSHGPSIDHPPRSPHSIILRPVYGLDFGSQGVRRNTGRTKTSKDSQPIQAARLRRLPQEKA